MQATRGIAGNMPGWQTSKDLSERGQTRGVTHALLPPFFFSRPMTCSYEINDKDVICAGRQGA